MDPTSYCSILVLQGPTRNPRGSLVLWLLLIFLASVRLPGGCFVAPQRLVHPIPALSFAALWMERGCAQASIPFPSASLILHSAPFHLSSWGCAQDPCTPSTQKTVQCLGLPGCHVPPPRRTGGRWCMQGAGCGPPGGCDRTGSSRHELRRDQSLGASC